MIKTTLKIFAVMLIIGFTATALNLWYNTFFMGQYYLHGSIFISTLLGIVAPLLTVLCSLYTIKQIIKR